MIANVEIFPRFRLKIAEDDVSPEVQDRRARFAAGPLARRMTAGVVEPVRAPEDTAEAFGREMFRLHGRAWPQMIALASGAAMKAEREALGEVK